LGGFALLVEFGEAFVAAGAHGLGGVVGGVGGQGFDLGDLGALGQVDAGQFLAEPVTLALALRGGLGVAGGDLPGQQGTAVGAEDVGVEEVADEAYQGVLADHDGAGVVGVGGGVAGVVGVVGAFVVAVGPGVARVFGFAGRCGARGAAHAALADPAADPTAQRIEPPGQGLGRGTGVVAGGAVRGADGPGGVEHGPGNDRGVDGLLGPDPLVGRDQAAGAVAAGVAAPAVDHVPGVFGVGQDGGGGGGPPVLAVRRRVGVTAGVEPIGEGGHAQVFFDPPGEDGRNDGAAQRVQVQAGLGTALGGLERDRVGYAARGEAVGGGADVPPRQGVLAQPFPGLLLDLQPEILGHALLDAADQHGGGAGFLDAGGLVGGEQRHALVRQLPLQLQRVVGVAAGPLDVLAHHRSEAGLGRGGFLQ
jgi:hypothetical protein